MLFFGFENGNFHSHGFLSRFLEKERLIVLDAAVVEKQHCVIQIFYKTMRSRSFVVEFVPSSLRKRDALVTQGDGPQSIVPEL